ncbi:unnamed protein product [Caenorhabditis brenneri]
MHKLIPTSCVGTVNATAAAQRAPRIIRDNQYYLAAACCKTMNSSNLEEDNCEVCILQQENGLHPRMQNGIQRRISRKKKEKYTQKYQAKMNEQGLR